MPLQKHRSPVNEAEKWQSMDPRRTFRLPDITYSAAAQSIASMLQEVHHPEHGLAISAEETHMDPLMVRIRSDTLSS